MERVNRIILAICGFSLFFFAIMLIEKNQFVSGLFSGIGLSCIYWLFDDFGKS